MAICERGGFSNDGLFEKWLSKQLKETILFFRIRVMKRGVRGREYFLAVMGVEKMLMPLDIRYQCQQNSGQPQLEC